MPSPVILIVRDGWGHSDDKIGNAIALAKTPYTDALMQNYPHTLVDAAGPAVGLPRGFQGNSEVGHLTIGSGRIVPQSMVRIDRAIEDGSFFRNEALVAAINHAKNNNSNVHIMGLIQDQGVHAQSAHIIAILKLAAQQGLKKEQVIVHAFTDGRDTPQMSAKRYLLDVLSALEKTGVGAIGTVIGRYYAMDRDKRFERTKIAYDALVLGHGKHAQNAIDAIDDAYAAGETDEFIKPRIIGKYGGMSSNDAIIMANFRLDRMRQLASAFTSNSFNEFEQPIKGMYVTCMMKYDEKLSANIAFPNVLYRNVLADVLAKEKVRQLRVSETEKYAHVTYFFNGQEENPRTGEDRVLIPSKKVATYDLDPAMCALDIANRVVEEIKKDTYGYILINLVNADMVGHTGVFDAVIKGIEAIDVAVELITNQALKSDGTVLICADHGNAECARNHDGSPHTSHTTNQVPVILVSKKYQSASLRVGGGLCDIAPTVLDILAIDKPFEMSGVSLIEHQSTAMQQAAEPAVAQADTIEVT